MDDLRHDATEVKEVANGRFHEIYAAQGLPSEQLNGKEHPCPKCGGKTRFRAMSDFAETGGIMCRHCDGPGGDIFAGLKWLKGCDFKTALNIVADHIGFTKSDTPNGVSVIEAVCRAKSMPLDAFVEFGAEEAKRGKLTVARVPVYNEDGEQFSYFDLSPTNKGLFKRGRGNAGLFFPGQTPKAGETWVLVEGVKDAAALVGEDYLACGLNRNEMNAKYAKLFRDVDVVIVPDLDEAGSRGADKTASRLLRIAKSVKIARLPGEIRKTGGDDVRDVIKRLSFVAVKDAIDEASEWTPVGNDGQNALPEIEVQWNEGATSLEVIRTLGLRRKAGVPIVFQRAGMLIQIISEPEPKSRGVTIPPSMERLVEIPKAILRELILESCLLWHSVQTPEGDTIQKYEKPPNWLLAAIHERRSYPPEVTPLSGIVCCPTLRPNGTIVQQRGYDEDMQLMYLPRIAFPKVPDQPNLADAKTAAHKLLDVVCDFPFVDDSHRSAWLSMVLTMVARPAINGPCPLFLIDANTRGSGKSKLCDVASILAYGSHAARRTWPRDDDEVRKSITAVGLAGLPSVLFDNVESKLGGASLDAALTSTTWEDRILGKSEMTVLQLFQVWMATGNNVLVGADTARRIMYCRLESPAENPEDRTGFQHGDVLGYVEQHRGELVAAAVTIMRAWFAAGKPIVAGGTWGSFEAWNDTIRQAIVWCELADPLETKKAIRQSDSTAEMLGLIHAAFDEIDPLGSGVTAGDLIHRLERGGFPAITAMFAELTDRPSSRIVGAALKRFKGRVKSGRKLNQRLSNGRRLWFLAQGASGASADTSSIGGDTPRPEVENPQGTASFRSEGASGTSVSRGVLLSASHMRLCDEREEHTRSEKLDRPESDVPDPPHAPHPSVEFVPSDANRSGPVMKTGEL